MPGILGQGTTFNLPNFLGEIYGLTPEDTPFLSSIGGLTGGKQASDKSWEWQFYDLRTPEDRTRVEGADAPVAEQRVRANARNVVEVHQEAIEISYSRLAAKGSIAPGVGTLGTNPIVDEEAWQLEQTQKQIARDIEFAFINGTFQNPSDNTTPRKTCGILAAIQTNVVDAGGGPMTEDMVLDLLQDAWDSGGLQENGTRVVMVNSTLKRSLTEIFITRKRLIQTTGTVSSVKVTQIDTDFGILNFMLNRFMPVDALAAVSLAECAPVHLMIPGKGFLFVEPLAKTGAAERSQIYGEVGLEYGNERHHAKLVNVQPAVPIS